MKRYQVVNDRGENVSNSKEGSHSTRAEAEIDLIEAQLIRPDMQFEIKEIDE